MVFETFKGHEEKIGGGNQTPREDIRPTAPFGEAHQRFTPPSRRIMKKIEIVNKVLTSGRRLGVKPKLYTLQAANKVVECKLGY